MVTSVPLVHPWEEEERRNEEEGERRDEEEADHLASLKFLV